MKDKVESEHLEARKDASEGGVDTSSYYFTILISINNSNTYKELYRWRLEGRSKTKLLFYRISLITNHISPIFSWKKSEKKSENVSGESEESPGESECGLKAILLITNYRLLMDERNSAFKFEDVN